MARFSPEPAEGWHGPSLQRCAAGAGLRGARVGVSVSALVVLSWGVYSDIKVEVRRRQLDMGG